MKPIFYEGKRGVSLDFKGEKLSSNGGILLIHKGERASGYIKAFSAKLVDRRDQTQVVHSKYKLLLQRVYQLTLGYEDCNDVDRLKDDGALGHVLGGALASQSTLSRFENDVTFGEICELSEQLVDSYVATLAGRDRVVIDVDATNDPVHGGQQMSMWSGYYEEKVYSQLFFHDGDTGEIILPVLRPGNAHSLKWFVVILRRIVEKIRAKYPQMPIYLRADAGFNSPETYDLCHEKDMFYAIGIPKNSILANHTRALEKEVSQAYGKEKEKHVEMVDFEYQAKTWSSAERVCAKVESTTKGMNTRYIVTNIEGTAREVYYDFYVLRGDRSENRIKEVKNMCFADRLSNHGFLGNFFRLIMSSISYNMIVRVIRNSIDGVKHELAKKWQVSSIRLYLLKAAVRVRVTKTRVCYRFSKSFVHQELMQDLLFG